MVLEDKISEIFSLIERVVLSFAIIDGTMQGVIKWIKYCEQEDAGDHIRLYIGEFLDRIPAYFRR